MSRYASRPHGAAKQSMTAWISTFSGRKFHPIEPDPEEVFIEDIAHALSNQCRFAGHVREFYSVGEHSILVKEIIRKEGWPVTLQFKALMHDAAEAFLVDLPRPIKMEMPTYREAETRVMAAISARFGIIKGYDEIIKKADAIALATEKKELMPATPEWDPGAEAIDIAILPYKAGEAKKPFLEAFHDLKKKIAAATKRKR